MTPAASAELLLLCVVMPLWIGAGLADWACHRWARIERTSGPAESWMHLLLLAQMSLPVLLALVFEPTALLLAIGLACLLAHAATTWAELRFVTARRPIAPTEQMVHSLMDVLPLTALLLLAIAAGPLASPAHPQALQLVPRDPPLPLTLVAGLVAASALMNWLPMLEELRRCYRARRGGLAAR